MQVIKVSYVITSCANADPTRHFSLSTSLPCCLCTTELVSVAATSQNEGSDTAAAAAVLAKARRMLSQDGGEGDEGLLLLPPLADAGDCMLSKAVPRSAHAGGGGGPLDQEGLKSPGLASLPEEEEQEGNVEEDEEEGGAEGEAEEEGKEEEENLGPPHSAGGSALRGRGCLLTPVTTALTSLIVEGNYQAAASVKATGVIAALTSSSIDESNSGTGHGTDMSFSASAFRLRLTHLRLIVRLNEMWYRQAAEPADQGQGKRGKG